MNHALGAIPSGADYRDEYAAIAAGVANEVESAFETPMPEPMHQRTIPACVGHSVVDLMKVYWKERTGQWIDFSPRFLDILSAQPDIPLEGGRRPRFVLKIAVGMGCCTTKTLPNDTGLSIGEYRDAKYISDAAYAEAQKYRIPGFVRVPVMTEREHARVYGAVSSLFRIGEELWTPSWDEKDIVPMRTPSEVVGGHQMTVYGWNGRYTLLQNEWGPLWASRGRTRYLPMDWAPYMVEQWAVASIPEDVSSLLRILPAPGNLRYIWRSNLRIGDHNDDVRFAQIALMMLGFMRPVPPDELGIYGTKTAAAVLAYQTARGVRPQSGYNIGPLTRHALNAEFAV